MTGVDAAAVERLLAEHTPACSECEHDPSKSPPIFCRPCSEAVGDWVTWTPQHVAPLLQAQHDGEDARAAVCGVLFDPHGSDFFLRCALPDGHDGHHSAALSSPAPAKAEAWTAAQIREAYERHASGDSWGVPSFYAGGLLAALRGEYDREGGDQ